MPEKRPVRCAPVGEVPDELGGLGPLGLGTAPDSVCPAVDFAVFPPLAVASLSAPVAVRVGDPVAGAVDLGASEIRVGDEELTVTDGADDSPAFTLVVDLRAPEDEPEAAEPPDPPEGVDSVGATEVGLARDVETAAEIEGDETEVEIGWDADSSEPGPGACT